MCSLPFTIPVYESHLGTVRVGGGTDCRKAATCALHYLAQGVGPVEFLFIGANAGQQATKAMGIFRYIVERHTDGKTTIIFQPNRVQVRLIPEEGGAAGRLIDAVCWRADPVPTAGLEALVNSPHAKQPIVIPEQ